MTIIENATHSFNREIGLPAPGSSQKIDTGDVSLAHAAATVSAMNTCWKYAAGVVNLASVT